MKLLSFLGFLLLTICISCTQRDKETITKFVFVNGIGISYDSLQKPQFEIQKYLEFSPSEMVLIAKGSRYTNYRISHVPKTAPPFSLDEFYKLDNYDSLEFKVNETFIGKSYDSLYHAENTEGRPYNFFIYETSKKIRKVVLYYKHAAPRELDSLDKFVNRIFETRKLLKTERFEVNKMVVEVQKKLFDKFPPPPPPSPVDSVVMLRK